MPRMYFIGVTTAASAIHRIFPRWAELAGVESAELAGIDLPVGAPAASCRAAISRIREDGDALGALVTTHKVALYDHARDLFTELDEKAEELGEIGCMVKRGERLRGVGIDSVTAGLALQALIDGRPFSGEALILGAGGAGVALATHLPRATLTDISPARVEQARRLTAARCHPASENDRLLEAMPPGSLIVNATGMGKDRPGAPIRAGARFPKDAVAWDLNYRGDLLFLDYARWQGIRAVDGWDYFLRSWSLIMSLVFGFDLTAELFDAMRRAAGSRS